MNPVNKKVILRVDMRQKNTIRIGEVTVSTALKYEKNYRERSPVVAEVVEGNKHLKAGEILLCHHNLFYPPSPYFLQDDLFAVPYSAVLFASVDAEGHLKPICGNIICQRVEIPSDFPLPPEYVKTYINRAKVIDAGNLPYKPGQVIFHRPNAGYDIVYVWQGIERRVTKVNGEMVCGVVK